MKRFVLIAICAGVMLTGCIESTTLLTVNRDGSGQILQRTFMNQQAQGLMAMAAMSQGQQNGGADMPSINLSSNELKAAAAKMGEGVSFVKSRKLQKENGSEGTEAMFTFKDVTKLKLDMTQTMAGSSNGEEKDGKIGGKNLSVFGFTKGTTPTLTLNIPKEPISLSLPSGGQDMPDNRASKAMMQQMMKSMLAGAKICVMLDVTGQITDSDATYITKSANSKLKNRVILMDVDLDTIMADPKGFDLISQMSDKTKSKEARELLAKEIAGVKIENKEKVFVTFR